MNEYIFTFGVSHKLGGTCQVVVAKDYDSARLKMFEEYGNEWAFQYTREDWEKNRNNPKRCHAMETELPTKLYAEVEI